jgi:glycerol-3-phosphate acyltransferase PlsX
MEDSNSKKIVIAIDLCGGDNAPLAVCNGVEQFILKMKSLNITKFGFIFVGNKHSKSLLKPELLKNNEFIETEEQVLQSDKPLSVARNKKTSMAICILAVRDKKAHACMSAGNTGALMAMSKLYFKPIPGITRPAISTIVPTKKNPTILLDMGANLVCDSDNLFEFAIMGSAFIKAAFNIKNPTIGLLNIGSEETKGTELVQDASKKIKNSLMSKNFIGYVEGNDINTGDVNVVVTDGFTGNIVLKAIEGIGKLMKHYLKQHFSATILAKIGYLLAKPELTKLVQKIDPNNYNGALFLGLEGIAIKSHGSANSKGIANAIEVAYKLAKKDLIENINSEINQIILKNNDSD